MTRFKVLPLDSWMKWCDYEEILEMGYTDVTLYEGLFHRDGQYYDRKLKIWWFEIGVMAYSKPRGERMFEYELELADCEILPKREVDGIVAVLNITRDSAVKVALTRRLRQHTEASQLRDTGRRAIMSRIRILGK